MRKNQMFTLILVTLLLLPEAGFAQVVYDNFNHPRWKIFTDGVGPDSEETNRRLEVVFPRTRWRHPVGYLVEPMKVFARCKATLTYG